jgi:hypothetical protein
MPLPTIACAAPMTSVSPGAGKFTEPGKIAGDDIALLDNTGAIEATELLRHGRGD